MSGTPSRPPGRTPTSPALALPRLGTNASSAQIAATYNQAATQIEGADRANAKRMQEIAVPALVMVAQPNGTVWRLWLDDTVQGQTPTVRLTAAR